jgi:hypothetical protein
MKYLTGKLKKIFKKIIPIIIILLGTAIFFYPVYLENKVPLPADALVGAHVPWTEMKWSDYPAGVPIKNLEISDSFSQLYPWRSLAGEYWRRAQAPLWNPYMLSGIPFLATLQSATLSPLNIFYTFLPDVWAWTAIVVMQVFLSALFMYLFLRSIKLPVLPSLFGALTFCFSGYMVGRLEYATGSQAGLWLPLLLLFTNKLWENRTFLYLAIVAGIFFMLFTAGDFQVPFYSVGIYVLYVLFKYFRDKNKQSFVYALVGLAAGILLAALQLMPTLDLYGQSIRAGDNYVQEYNYGLLDFKKITNFIWPDFYGNVVTGNYWGTYTYHEYIAFVGVCALLLALYSLLKKKSSEEKFVWFIFVLSLLFLFPNPIALLPYKLHLPGLSSSLASRILFVSGWCLSVLSAYGLAKAIKNKFSNLWPILIILLVISLSVFMALIGYTKFANLADMQLVINLKVAAKNIIPSLIILFGLGIIIWLARFKTFVKYLPVLVLLLAALEMYRFAWKNTPFAYLKFVFPDNPVTEYLKEADKPLRIAGGIPTNLFMQYRLESVEGYEPLYPTLGGKWVSALDGGDINIPARRYGLLHNFKSNLLNYAGVDYIIDYKRGPFDDINIDGKFKSELLDKRFVPVVNFGRVAVFENLQSLPRVYLTNRYLIETDPAKIVKLLENNSRIVVLEKPPSGVIKGQSFNTTNIFYSQGLNKVTVTASSELDTILVLSESYAPGWRVYLDGKEAELLVANFAYRAVVFPQGEHKVEYIYSPKSFRIGKWISISTLLFLFGIIFYEQITKKRS